MLPLARIFLTVCLVGLTAASTASPEFEAEQHEMQPLLASRQPVNVDDALRLLDEALLHGRFIQTRQCLRYIEPRIRAALASPVIPQLQGHTMLRLMSHPWRVHEIEVFRAVKRWYDSTSLHHSSPTLVTAVVNTVHLVALSEAQLRGDATWSGMFSRLQISNALEIKRERNVQPDHLRISERLPGTKDVVDQILGAEIISPNMLYSEGCSGHPVLNSPATPGRECYSYQRTPASTTIKLGMDYDLSYIRIVMPHLSYGYCNFAVDMSPDNARWTTVMDMRTPKGLGYDIETRTFEPMTVRYIRISSQQCFQSNGVPLSEFRILALQSY